MRDSGSTPKRVHRLNIIWLATLNREEPKKQNETESNSSKKQNETESNCSKKQNETESNSSRSLKGKKLFHVLCFMNWIWIFWEGATGGDL